MYGDGTRVCCEICCQSKLGLLYRHKDRLSRMVKNLEDVDGSVQGVTPPSAAGTCPDEGLTLAETSRGGSRSRAKSSGYARLNCSRGRRGSRSSTAGQGARHPHTITHHSFAQRRCTGVAHPALKPAMGLVPPPCAHRRALLHASSVGLLRLSTHAAPFRVISLSGRCSLARRSSAHHFLHFRFCHHQQHDTLNHQRPVSTTTFSVPCLYVCQ